MIETIPVERIGAMRCQVGESPLWHAGERALYWTDIPARQLWRWNRRTGHADYWTLPEMAGCIALIDEGGIALAMETGIYRVPHPVPGMALGAATLLASVTHARTDMRFNDGRCDRQGRFIAGTMVLDTTLAAPLGQLLRLDVANDRIDQASQPGRLALLAGDLIVSNGLAFSPDGRTMYLSDSHASRRMIWAFDYDIDTATPHDRRIFVDMNAYAGRPDGAAIDEDGCYWICGNDAGCVYRFTPAGRLDRSIAVPAAKPAMCAFGGEGRETLFVTSIEAADDPLGGAVFALEPGVKGMPEPALRLQL
ncbi:SMP-30/gluconolactonase/LRE family protein [Trinickia sp. LjRoot230]|uniref:SMP-30/gluconolactonase/LRE family protein n=1 Tax=Trinickia sp. LjRoot230 TaxID=3342288 RepID=UPI003ED15084